MVAGHTDDIDGQLIRALLEQQSIEAVRGLRHEDQSSRLLLHRLEADRHIKTVSRLGEGGLQGPGIGIVVRDELDTQEELEGIGGGELLGLGDVGTE